MACPWHHTRSRLRPAFGSMGHLQDVRRARPCRFGCIEENATAELRAYAPSSAPPSCRPDFVIQTWPMGTFRFSAMVHLLAVELLLGAAAPHHTAGAVDRRVERDIRLTTSDPFEVHCIVAHAAADEAALTRERRGGALADDPPPPRRCALIERCCLTGQPCR
jgi:hypothetical protein